MAHSYRNIHMWLFDNYGKADRCENPSCKGNGALFEWSLIKGKEYKKDRSNFQMLCSACHRIYDGNASKTKGLKRTEEQKERMRVSRKKLFEGGYQVYNKGIPMSEEQKVKISASKEGKGHSHTEQSRKKISESNKGRVPGFLGKTHSQETKQKQRISRLNYLKLKEKNYGTTP